MLGCGVRRPDAREIDARYRGPVRSRDVARGRNRYEVVCVPCHGDHDERQGPLLASLHWTPEEIRHQVREGNSLMPAIPRRRLSDDDLEHLLAFLSTTGACVPSAATREGIHAARSDAAMDLGAPRRDARSPARDGSRRGGDAGAARAPDSDTGLLDLDAGTFDAGTLDAGTLDAGTLDAGTLDAGTLDAGTHDAGLLDEGGITDVGPLDAGTLDVGPFGGDGSQTHASDVSASDAAVREASLRDASMLEREADDGSVER